MKEQENQFFVQNVNNSILYIRLLRLDLINEQGKQIKLPSPEVKVSIQLFSKEKKELIKLDNWILDE